MKTHDCQAIRREIDEANLDGRLTREASEHLSQCDECRRFQKDQRTLRAMMADLETVGAPADFDFRLRARLARERPSNGSRGLLFSARPIAALALMILIAIIAVVVKRGVSPAGNPPPISKTFSKEGGTPVNTVTPNTPTGVPSSEDNSRRQEVSLADSSSKRVPVPRPNDGPRNIAAPRTPNSSASVPRLSTRESAAEGAQMITPEAIGSLVVVPIDARAFKVSVDNGHGSARTISLPPVSFGSQRLSAREASFVPASSAKGDW